jgi:hypothetical protein
MSDYENTWILSIDPGTVNFCFYIEEFNINDLKMIKNIPKEQRYLPNGSCTTEFKEILKKVYLNGKKILLKNIDITKTTTKNKYFDIEYCYNITDILDEYSWYFDRVSYIIIEMQMSFKNKHNTKALKIAQHCESYFIFKYSRFKTLVEFPAYYKTQTLGCEKIKIVKKGKVSYKNIEKPERKKWCVEKGTEILTEREDFTTLYDIVSNSKKDDKMDTICQIQAFKYLYFVDNKKF